MKKILFLMKISSKEHIDDLRSGKMYMKPLQFFIDIKNNDVIGDNLEGTLRIKKTNLKIFDLKTNEKVYEISSDIDIDFGFKDNPVFCMYAFDERNYYSREKINSKEILCDFRFDEKTKDVLKDFGEKTLIINDITEFRNRVKQAAERQNIKYKLDIVDYYEDYNDTERIIDVLKNNSKVVFQKQEKYSYQQEFRILMDTQVEDHFILDIGDISDITKVFDTNTILNSGLKLRIKI